MSTSDYIGPDDVMLLDTGGGGSRDTALRCATAVMCAMLSASDAVVWEKLPRYEDKLLSLADRFEEWLDRP